MVGFFVLFKNAFWANANLTAINCEGVHGLATDLISHRRRLDDRCVVEGINGQPCQVAKIPDCCGLAARNPSQVDADIHAERRDIIAVVSRSKS
jgi:hypothetical protein